MLARLNQNQTQRHHSNRQPSLFWQAYPVYQYYFNAALSRGAVVFFLIGAVCLYVWAEGDAGVPRRSRRGKYDLLGEGWQIQKD